ncbi:MAG: hypothetical protein PHS76_08285, partial [Sphaerochaeta sp.]|nr:hypothetical protein [Sphaerochaeta sp.]
FFFISPKLNAIPIKAKNQTKAKSPHPQIPSFRNNIKVTGEKLDMLVHTPLPQDSSITYRFRLCKSSD